jgi:serine/threonine protein kinase
MNAQPFPTAFDKDLYGLMQVHPRADPVVLDAAFRALMKLHAPRKADDKDTMAKEISQAYSILSVSSERRKYNDYRNRILETSGIGPYTILGKVARGGFGTTYKARHNRSGGLSCIKQCSEISQQSEEILKAESQAVWDLHHFGIPTMRDLLELPDGSLALVMSWVSGPTLEKIVQKAGKLDPEHVAWIAQRIIDTLGYLHDHEVVHGDIKPQNTIIQPRTHTAVLVDYGLSSVRPTAKTIAKGYTELFSPPEQLTGDKPLLPESDFYSLGMTMIYALTGDYRRVQNREIPNSVPEPMEKFIYKLIRQNILERPQRANELFDEIRDVRMKSFGRERTGSMKPFPSVDED